MTKKTRPVHHPSVRRPAARSFLLFVLLALATTLLQRAGAEEVLIDSLAWRPLTETAGAGLTWNDVASVCPLDETPCQGSVKGVDFTGWTWASQDRVRRLIETLTGLEIPFDGPFESPVELFFDRLAPVLETNSVQMSYGLVSVPGVPTGSTVDAFWIQDARISAGNDKVVLESIFKIDNEVTAPIFGLQPLGAFLVRDPELELCGNGLDDDGDGKADIDDGDCEAANPVIDGREWRQLKETTGIGFWDVVAVCPVGAPCDGSAGGVDFTGWTWAHSLEVRELLLDITGLYLGISSAVLPWNSPAIPRFFDWFEPTNITATSVSTHGFTYNTTAELSRTLYPAASNIDDPTSCLNNFDDDGDGEIDFDDSACRWREYVTLTDGLASTSADVIGTIGGALDETGPNVLPVFGYYLHRAPVIQTPESCNNTLDDDGDGLVDGLDEDCVGPKIGLRMRCMHDPVYYPDGGGVVTIRAEALDGDGQPVTADTVEIWRGSDSDAPQLQAANTKAGMLVFQTSATFSYACSATRGSETYFTGWRAVAVGDVLGAGFPAIPVLLNGPLAEKIDVVFFADRDEYTSFDDPDFLEDVQLLLHGGYLTVPWLARFQEHFNFWIGKDVANSGPDPDDQDASDGILCLREAPEDFGKKYTFANSAGIVHRSACRDNAGSPGIFTIQVNLNLLQVVAHETGHRPFGLADEYCCDGGYFTRSVFGPPYPNMFTREDGCRSKAADRDHDPDLCRSLVDSDNGKDWWLFEPAFSTFDPDTTDLMQQTGCDRLADTVNCRRIEPTHTGADGNPNGLVACGFPLETYVGDPDGVADSGDETFWVCRNKGSATNAVWASIGSAFDRYDAGPSERDRLSWFLSECLAGRC